MSSSISHATTPLSHGSFSSAGRHAESLKSMSGPFGKWASSAAMHFGDPRFAAKEDFFSQMWAPGLLDRLQVPLTRYHE
jgi:hypothetical protein